MKRRPWRDENAKYQSKKKEKKHTRKPPKIRHSEFLARFDEKRRAKWRR